MNKQKGVASILLIVLGLVVIGSGIFVYYQKSDLGIFSNKTKEAVPPQTDENGELWSIFDNVVLSLKNKDVNLYNKYSYKQVSLEEEGEFLEMTEGAYNFSTLINKAEYINNYKDDIQFVYTTDVKIVDDSGWYSHEQGIVIFVKKDNSWKLLSFNPSNGSGYNKSGTNMTVEEIEMELQITRKDSDNDFLSDYKETCIRSIEFNIDCEITDPNNPDSNNDGWLDGVENAMNEGYVFGSIVSKN